MNKIIVLYGPTAIGKSGIAIELAKIIDAEIISADSMQIYKDLNIGSAKISKNEMQGIKHHLINIKNCNENYSVFEFVTDCKNAIKRITEKGKNVIIVGGTGLYIKALTENYNYGGSSNNANLRIELNALSTKVLLNKALKLNINLKNEDKNNRHRLIRYIEIKINGEGVKKQEFDDNYMIFGLTLNRDLLYQRINNRVDKMMEDGLLDETKYLLTKVNEDSQSLKAIGYKELIPYLEQNDTLENCVNILKQKTRNYAKRQITFMNQFPNIIKIDVTDTNQAVLNILDEYKKM